jgi:hypothetical protein
MNYKEVAKVISEQASSLDDKDFLMFASTIEMFQLLLIENGFLPINFVDSVTKEFEEKSTIQLKDFFGEQP